MRSVPAATILLAIALGPMAHADHCEGWSTTLPEVDTAETAAGRWYLDNDLCQMDCFSHLNVYEESNGLDGLQRQDHNWDDTCHGAIAPDTFHGNVPY